MNFQGMILTLQSFWAEQNCVLVQPYDVEKGAGTLNPMTFLRSIGPEHGTSLMSSLPAVLPMDATARIRTGFTSITSFRSS